MKYIIILILILSSVLFFINKDDMFSKYSINNMAAVSGSDSDEYEEPVRNLSKMKVSVEKSTSTKKVISPNVINASTTKNSAKSVSYYGETFFPVDWNFYIDNKFWYGNTYSFPAYLSQTFYFNDETWNYWQKNGFYKGTKVNDWYYLYTDQYIWNITINGYNELNTYFQSCAEPYPKHVFFKNINTLERKLVKFANNKGDKNLGIKAKGEVGAIAVVYSDGGVCAQFTEGCLGEVSCDIEADKNFFKSYKEKSIKNILTFHTHDYNSGSKYWSAYEDDGTRINTILSIPPSFSDLKMNWYFKETLSNNNIFPNLSLVEKVISPTGEGYVYDVTKKSIITKAKDNKLDILEKNIVNGYSEAQDKSMLKNKRKYPILKDIQVGIDYMVTATKKLNVNIKPFTVN